MPRHIYYDNLVGIKVRKEQQYTYISTTFISEEDLLMYDSNLSN